MTIALDATFGNLVDQNSWQTNSSFTIAATNKTAAGSTLVVAVITYESTTAQGQRSVSSLSVSGLTFTKRGSVQNNLNSANHASAELWTAQASSQFNSSGSSLTWTLTFSGTVDNAQICVFAITGLFSLSSPFDSGSLPQTAANASSTTPPTVTFSTSQAHDMLLFISLQASASSTQQPSTPSGWTKLQGLSSSTGVNFLEAAVFYKLVTSAQSGATVADANANNDFWTAYVDAFTSDNNNLNVSATVGLTLSGVSISVAETTHEEGGTAAMTLDAVSFSAHESEATHGAVSFSLTKIAMSLLAGTYQGATNIVGKPVLRIVRGIRDTITNNSVVGRVPGGDGGAQIIPMTMIADMVGRLLAGGVSSSPTTKSVGASALQKQTSSQITAAINNVLVPPCNVSALPAGFDGQRGFVKDSTQTLAAGIGTAVVGGSTHHVPVYFDGGSGAWMIG